MAKYEVITIAVAVKNNRIARFGETVDDSELTVNGNALVEAGSLKLIEEKSTKEKKETTTEEVVEETAAEKATEETVAKEEVVETKKAETAAEKAAKK